MGRKQGASSGNLHSQPVTALPGIGAVYGRRLNEAGYTSAGQVMDKMNSFGGNQAQFQSWLKSECNSNSRWSNSTYQALRSNVSYTPTYEVSEPIRYSPPTQKVVSSQPAFTFERTTPTVPPIEKQNTNNFNSSNNAPVTSLPGIGPVYGERLNNAGITTAGQIEDKLKSFGGDQVKFEAWLKDTCGSNSRWSNTTYQAIKGVANDSSSSSNISTEPKTLETSVGITKNNTTSKSITILEGIGKVYGKRLEEAGIRTVDQLIQKLSSFNGNKEQCQKWLESKCFSTSYWSDVTLRDLNERFNLNFNNSTKNISFDSSSLNDKPLTYLTGIGDIYASKLTDAGFTNAGQLLSKFKSFNGNQEEFQRWISDICGANSWWSNECWRCLRKYTDPDQLENDTFESNQVNLLEKDQETVQITEKPLLSSNASQCSSSKIAQQISTLLTEEENTSADTTSNNARDIPKIQSTEKENINVASTSSNATDASLFSPEIVPTLTSLSTEEESKNVDTTANKATDTSLSSLEIEVPFATLSTKEANTSLITISDTGLVTSLPTIGPIFGTRLINKGYITVGHLKVKFNSLGRDEAKCRTWLINICNMNAHLLMARLTVSSLINNSSNSDNSTVRTEKQHNSQGKRNSSHDILVESTAQHQKVTTDSQNDSSPKFQQNNVQNTSSCTCHEFSSSECLKETDIEFLKFIIKNMVKTIENERKEKKALRNELKILKKKLAERD